ncbi:MAG: alpha/beta hydrolase, partial [Clostridia bacterium]|nr:alpha/beta hydrolase [Clostridia bacterium]
MDAFVNGIRLHYEQYGEGRPLVLLHGNGEDHTIFDEAVTVLSERFTCFALDSRGHGDSDMVGELHYEDMASDLLAFLEELDLWDVVLCGYSDGGIVALMAARWTDRISDLIVCGANTRPRALKRRAYMDIRWEHRQDPNISNTILLTEPHIPAEDLRAIEVRTLVVAGSRDIIRERNTRFIAE